MSDCSVAADAASSSAQYLPRALELLHLAEEYKVRPSFVKLFRPEIVMENCVQVFQTARLYGRDDLVDRAGEIMAKSLQYLLEKNALANAEEETLMYLLERDDLTVKEVELFKFILKWGKDRVSHTERNLLRHKLKNVIPLIRYTTMTPHEFTAVVVPTGLLSGEEMLSVYSYVAGDEAMRSNMKIKFNTAMRKLEPKAIVDFYAGYNCNRSWSSKDHPLRLCTSFQVLIKKKLWASSASIKPALTAIKINLPWRDIQCSALRGNTFHFGVCVKDCSGPVSDKSVSMRFSKDLLYLYSDKAEIPVEPPVELISGRTYCVIVQDQSHHQKFPMHGYDQVYYVYSGYFGPNELHSEVEMDLGVADLMLKEIQKDSRLTGFQDSTADCPINVIRGIKVSLL